MTVAYVLLGIALGIIVGGPIAAWLFWRWITSHAMHRSGGWGWW